MSADRLRALRAVVFDFDGTLAETRIDFGLMRRRTVEVIQQWGAWVPGLDEGRYVLELVEAAASRLAHEPAAAAHFRAAAMQAIEDVEMLTCSRAAPFAGVAEALEALRETGLTVGIITRNCRRAVESVLQRQPLPHDALFTRDDVARVKPDPGHLFACLGALGVPPGEALMVGDHPTDMQCGHAAGALTCGVLTDSTGAAELVAAGAQWVLLDIPSLARMLHQARA
jgi:phosphoglycolate phosphatase